MRRGIWLIGLLWAIGISVYIMFAPMVTSVGVSESFPRNHGVAQAASDYSKMSWYQTKGLSAARPLVIPILLTCLPVLILNIRARRIVGVISLILLAVFCVFTIFSIGSYYVPSVIALVVAALFDRPCRMERGVSS